MIQRMTLWKLGHFAAILLLTAYACAAQLHESSHTAHQASSNSAGVVDGAVDPQQIPDVVAYLLFFTTASEQTNSAIDEKARQRAFLSSAGLSQQEIERVAVVLADFRKQYSEISQAPQTLAASSAVISPEHDALVVATRAALATCLGRNSVARIEQFVQSEKSKMRMTAPQPMS